MHIFIKNSNRLVRYYLTRVFFATEFYNRLVRYCLTRVHLLQRFNNLVRYYLTRIFLLKISTGLSSAT